MTVRGTLHHLSRLVMGSRSERAQARYLARMTFRGVDLRGASLRDLQLTGDRSCWYTNSGGPSLSRVLDSLEIRSTDAALDIGCGKGGAMLTLAQYPFAQVDGVEISAELVKVARRNLQKMSISKASVFCADAATLQDLDPYSFFYMFNPFPAVVMDAVLHNLAASLQRRTRKVVVLYRNPECSSRLLSSGFRLERSFTFDALPIHLYTKES